MGGCVSRRSSSSFNNVRVVHLNGSVHHYDTPVTALHLTGKPADHFLCTPARLLAGAGDPALKPNELLQPGKLYLMLPFSTLRPDVSPADLVSLSRKLTAAAAKSPSPANRLQEWSSQGRSPWRPELDTIKEKPLNQRSESDLQEKYGRK